ncbi:hypothetical protein Tco_0276666 [Tanacetum coccineum]
MRPPPPPHRYKDELNYAVPRLGLTLLCKSHPTPRVQACYEHPTRDLSLPPSPTLLTTLPHLVPREAPPQLALLLDLLISSSPYVEIKLKEKQDNKTRR